ncbi:hypothetical protein AHAS_Ahas05G0217700 [Arachis hypogaea]
MWWDSKKQNSQMGRRILILHKRLYNIQIRTVENRPRIEDCLDFGAKEYYCGM